MNTLAHNNREINFRVWMYNKFIYGVFIHATNGAPYVWNFEENDLVPLFSEDQIRIYGKPIIQQYTGFKDSEGKNIYEGDIFEGNDKYKWDPIVFDQGKFSANLQGARVYDLCELFGDANAPRVIGNNCEIIK